MEVSKLGRVRKLQLPDDWLNVDKVFGEVGNSYLLYFTPTGKKDVQLCIYYRGRLLRSDLGKRFLDLLAMPAHHLSADELKNVEAVLENLAKAELFDLSQARTEDLNGNMVLLAEGSYRHIDQRTYAIYFACDDEGCSVQEIFYCAPEERYQEYFPLVLSSLKSIEWI